MAHIYIYENMLFSSFMMNTFGRCRGGENNEGGAGSVTRVLPNFFYDIKYVINGMEKHVDACFVEKTRLVCTFLYQIC